MKLQLAIDTLDSDQAIQLMHRVGKYIDIIEVGTPLIIKEGVQAVKKIKQAFPNHTVLADLKIMDAGEFEAGIAFEAGADIVTVLGTTHDSTIAGCVKAAKQFGGQIMADMICVQNLADRAGQIEKLGVDYICVHTAFDEQSSGASPLEELKTVTQAITVAGAAVAGG